MKKAFQDESAKKAEKLQESFFLTKQVMQVYNKQRKQHTN